MLCLDGSHRALQGIGTPAGTGKVRLQEGEVPKPLGLAVILILLSQGLLWGWQQQMELDMGAKALHGP